MSQLLTISETARRSGVASSALRYYEERGLIAAEREGSGQRRYPRPVLRRIAFIVFAQKVGLRLDEIAVERSKRRADREAGAPQGGPHRGHRLRLPLARPLQAGEPGRRRRALRLRPALLAPRSPTPPRPPPDKGRQPTHK